MSFERVPDLDICERYECQDYRKNHGMARGPERFICDGFSEPSRKTYYHPNLGTFFMDDGVALRAAEGGEGG